MNGTTVIFDLDGTLIDTAPDLVHALNHVMAKHGCPEVAIETVRHTVGYGARRMIVEGLHQAGASDHFDPDALLPDFLDHYAANIAVESRPFDGMVEALQRLREAGARTGICTNKRESLSRLLIGKLGLDACFDAIVGRDTFPYCKPDPRHLLGAIDKAGGEPARAVMVGDSSTDIKTAKAASVPVVFVTFGYGDGPIEAMPPEASIDSYAELGAAVARLLPVAA